MYLVVSRLGDIRPTYPLLCVGMKLSDPDLFKTAQPLIITNYDPQAARFMTILYTK